MIWQSGPQAPGGGGGGAWCRCPENTQWVTQSLCSLVTQNGKRWHVSVNSTPGSFRLVHNKDRIPSRSPLGAASERMSTWSKKCNPASAASMLWCPHLLYAQQLAASCLLPVSVSWPPSFPSSQCLWLPGVPMTVFLQSFLFILGLPSYPGSELYKREIPVVWQENEDVVWLFTKGYVFSRYLREHPFAFRGGGSGTRKGEKSTRRKDNSIL